MLERLRRKIFIVQCLTEILFRRIRAAYQHCCLRYVMNQRMTNQSLRERFRLPENKAESVSRAIRDTVNDGKIKPAETGQTSLRYRHYVPIWA